MILFYGLDSWHANLFRNFDRRRLQKLAQGRRSWLWGWPGHLLPELKVHRDLALPSHSARSGWYWAGPLFQYHNSYWDLLLMSISPVSIVIFPKSETVMLSSWYLPTMTSYVLFMFVVKWTLEKAANIDGFSIRTSSIPSLVSCSTTVRRPWRISLVGIKLVFKPLNNRPMHRSKFCRWTIILIFRRGSLQGV